MTTFQDPQPQSRRAIRQRERGEPFETQEPAPQFYPDPSVSGDAWDTVARRAAQLSPPPDRTDASVATGRRAAPAVPNPPAEPLNYSTEARGVVSGEQLAVPPAQQTFRRRGTSVQPTDQAPIAAAHSVEVPSVGAAVVAAPQQPNFRVRDFSPGGGHPSASSVATPPVAAPAAPSDLDYRTEARLHYEVPVAPAAPQSTLPFEQTLTRRELHAKLAAEQARLGVQQVDSSATTEIAPSENDNAVTRAFPPAPQPKADTALTSAIAEFDALTQRSDAAQRDLASQAAAQQAAAQRAAQEQAAAQAAQLAQQEAQQTAAEAAAAWAAQQQAQQVAAEQAAVQQAAQQAAVQQAAAQQAAAQQAAVQPAPQPEAPTGWAPPLGHWSAQATADDQDAYGNTVNRTVGGAPATTNALVIPTIPGVNDIRGPLTGTGEIMLTGSIDLPRSFSSTGASARFDAEGIDAFFDAGDAEVTSTDSAPVRAIRAVSTHNSGQGVTHTQKPKGTRGLTFLLIAASSMAVVVAGLLVTAFALNIF